MTERNESTEGADVRLATSAGKHARKTKTYNRSVSDLYTNSHRVPGSSCWLWDGCVDGRLGLPRIYSFDHEAGVKRVMSVAKAIFNIAYKAGPGSKFVYRFCGCRTCVNPDHLAIADTRSQMLTDMAQRVKGRGKPPRRPSVLQMASIERVNGRSMLSPETVGEIFRAAGRLIDVGAAYGVSPQTVCKIKKRQAYKWVDVGAAV